MLFNHASKILFNLLLPEFETFLSVINKEKFAISPLSEVIEKPSIDFSFIIKSNTQKYLFLIKTEKPTDELGRHCLKLA